MRDARQGGPPELLTFVSAIAFAAGMVVVFGYFLGVGLRLAGVCA